MHIRQLKADEQLPLHLLFADPSEKAIMAYLPYSIVFIAQIDNELVGEYVLFEINADEAEIKNIAVEEAHQGKGIGKTLLKDATGRAKEHGYKKLLIGTSNASVGQLYLYQQQGFEITDIKYNFFLENYTEPILENGIVCKHMIMLSTTL